MIVRRDDDVTGWWGTHNENPPSRHVLRTTLPILAVAVRDECQLHPFGNRA
jgi:hypothetical protein